MIIFSCFSDETRCRILINLYLSDSVFRVRYGAWEKTMWVFRRSWRAVVWSCVEERVDEDVGLE